MLRADSQEKRCFTRLHKTDPMMEQHLVQSKILGRGIGNYFHLVLCHRVVRLVIDPVNFTTVFHLPNHSPKIDERAGHKIDIFLWRL